ncbi:efflux RND transporter periplasmic adaptor subunit (plasmid) [Paracoccus sp. TK19116]|uniref:Efflux RND transporter periplasmic adaptor subunit n=1 Tax=Paracoccus albicereus TaxID=2922394 RepID=A0ABT1MKU2_9RHOB|nr:efflux RND transporter periplasmic adaptor subunit [Paracoccus albicereus]MCQ0968920.1 efflux RND transporter periplasmic adaptor subunit [Paracoccus albicereus]
MRSLLAALALTLLAQPSLAQDDVAASPAAAPSVTVASAQIAEVRAEVPVSGTLVARQEVQVFPQVSGFEITELLVEAGDQVTAGQLLARVSDSTLAAQLKQAEAEYQRAQAGVGQARSQIASAEAARTQAVTALDRAQRLRDSGNASQAALDQAVAAEANAQAQAASASDGLAVAEAALAQADAARSIAALNLEHTRIKAPVAGLIVDRNARLGAIAAPGAEPLFTIVAGGDIEVSAEVIETALQSLEPGLPARVQVAGVGAIEGKVRLVPASVDPVTRLGLVRISLTSDPRLRTGLFASGWITTAVRDAVTIPSAAILADAEGETVRVVGDAGMVEVRPVRAGLLWDGRREIAEGLAEGETVIARSGAFFRTGDQITPIRPAEPAQPTDAPSPTASTTPQPDRTPIGAADAAEAPATTASRQP